MFSLPRVSLPSFLSGRNTNHPKVDIPSVKLHDIENDADKRPRTLKHLIKANHANYAIIYHDLRFHNHTPHILGSAYILGSSAEHLNEIYENEAEELEPWSESPGEISHDDWRDFLGKREYQRAFIDFLEDQLVSKRYDLQELLDEYLLGGKEPLINGMISGLAHPLIHLGYAYELQSKTIAVEALAMAACFYSPLHKYINDPKYTKPSPYRSEEKDQNVILDLLTKVQKDKRFDGLYDHGSGDISRVFGEREEELLEYWNGWEIVDPKKQFEQAQCVAVSMLLETPPQEKGKLDFFFVHILTSSHAIRILLPLVPAKFHINLLRQWWLFTLAVYIAQMRPPFDQPIAIEDSKTETRDWKYVVHQALDGPHSKDAHYVKALRSLQVCEETWGAKDGWFLKAALKFVDEFGEWGFGTMENPPHVAYPDKEWI